MQRLTFETMSKEGKRSGIRLLLLIASSLLAGPLGAQQKGPLPPPPPGSVTPVSAPPTAGKAGSGAQDRSSRITNEPPSMPIEEIVQKFTAREEEFRKERDHFTYTQVLVFQTLDEDGQVDGEFQETRDILFTPDGKRYDHVVHAPVTTLNRLDMTQQDFDDIEKVWPFVMTPAELPKYEVKYVGRERVDEIGAYVFDLTPKKLEKGQRYFQGRVWVEDQDLQIVKTSGTSTGLLKKKEDQAFPRFENFRENIEGRFWFPTYTRSEDTLHFRAGPDVRIRVAVRYENYKRFGSTIKISKPTQVDPEKP